MAFRLNNELITKINQLASDLNTAAETFRDDWSGRSERWQEGDTGTAVDAWIESLDNLVSDLEAVEAEPES
jgi:hypothetical protein